MGEPRIFAGPSGDAEAVWAFYKTAKSYCLFIDSMRDGRPPNVYEELLTRLSAIAASICKAYTVGMRPIQEVLSELANGWGGAEGAAEADTVGLDTYAVSTEVYWEMQEIIAEAMSYELKQENRVREEYDEAMALDMHLLPSDLAELYQHLLEGVRLYEVGTSMARREAAGQWFHGYRWQWWHHLMRAMGTVHAVAFSAAIEHSKG